MSNAGSETDSESPHKYQPFQLGPSEDLEWYEPGGFHPVHLQDVYDSRYSIVHKLGFGGFSTVWLARDSMEDEWVALKILASEPSTKSTARSNILEDNDIQSSALFCVPKQEFWIDGPNGRHLCFVLPVVGPSCSSLSKGIYSTMKPALAASIGRQAVEATALLHSKGFCHGGKIVSHSRIACSDHWLTQILDLTAGNLTLRLSEKFQDYKEEDIYQAFGRPLTDPIETYSGKPAGPSAPEYIVKPLDFCVTPTNLSTSRLCLIDFDQCFQKDHPPERIGTPAIYMAPEVAVGKPPSEASDIWALGCVIFRMRSADDIFLDYDTCCPAQALQQIERTIGNLPDGWADMLFDEDGWPTTADSPSAERNSYGFPRLPLKERIFALLDEPPSLFMNSRGEPETPAEDPAPPRWPDDGPMRVPYAADYRSMIWKPTAVCIDGDYYTSYSDEMEDAFRGAFPRIRDEEASLLLDLLSRIFVYDAASRPSLEEIAAHPWLQFHHE